jgi:hypothetical protein
MYKEYPTTQHLALFLWLISHHPAVLLSQNKPATSNQPTVLFSQNKSAPAVSHQPNKQTVYMCLIDSEPLGRVPWVPASYAWIGSDVM